MKVSGLGGPSAGPTAKPTRSSAGFTVSGGAPAAATGAPAAAASVTGVAGVTSLMALQGVEDPTERRRRAIRRGSGLLDRLEQLKLAILSGDEGAAALGGLSRTLAEERPSDLDPDLSSLLQQIDLRAAVELAKADLRRKAV